MERASATIIAIVAIAGLIACAPAESPSPEESTSGAGLSRGQGPRDYSEVMKDLAEMYNVEDPPDVKVIREITPAESKQVIDDCLVERGWTMVNGGFQYPADQDRAYKRDSYICTVSYPIRAEYLTPLDDAAWRRVFEYWISETVPCLERQGLDVPEPPSVETFLETRSWTPDGDEVRSQVEQQVSSGKFSNVEHVFHEVCPVSPPPEVRFGK